MNGNNGIIGSYEERLRAAEEGRLPPASTTGRKRTGDFIRLAQESHDTEVLDLVRRWVEGEISDHDVCWTLLQKGYGDLGWAASLWSLGVITDEEYMQYAASKGYGRGKGCEGLSADEAQSFLAQGATEVAQATGAALGEQVAHGQLSPDEAARKLSATLQAWAKAAQEAAPLEHASAVEAAASQAQTSGQIAMRAAAAREGERQRRSWLTWALIAIGAGVLVIVFLVVGLGRPKRRR
jgi:hypothetical protein